MRGVESTWHVTLWIARLSATAAVILLMMIVIGEPGAGPAGMRERVYLALFPFGFAAAYLAGWRWPLAAGVGSILCMAASLIVVGRVFPPEVYMYWGILSIPGILYVLAGMKLRRSHQTPLSRALCL